MDNTKTLNILPFFLNIAADKWLDWEGNIVTGLDIFNKYALEKGVPVCQTFTCGSQAADDGIVSLYIENPSKRYSGYGFNDSKEVSTDFSITLMLPSGAFGQDRLKQLLVYEEILLHCLELTFSEPAGCVSGWNQDSFQFNYYSIGPEDFSPSQMATKIEKTKIEVLVSAQAYIQGV